MRFLWLLLVSLILVLTGCTNPTHAYHPLEVPERSKGEVVKYEGVIPQTKSRTLAYESRVGDSTTLFTADRFCYDPQNSLIIVPKYRNTGVGGPLYNEDLTGGLYIAIPKDSVTLCKDGIKNNSYFSRNHLLHGFVIGGIVGGTILGLGSVAISPFIAFMSQDGSVIGSVILFGTSVGAALGGAIGFAGDAAINSGNWTEDIDERCSAYYSDMELMEYLEQNSCY